MGLQHQHAPIVGMQFHPESILTEYGFQLLANFLQLAGMPSNTLPQVHAERLPAPAPSILLPSTPVTF
jgi:GMP synthase-like glutamine amidotransferase